MPMPAVVPVGPTGTAPEAPVRGDDRSPESINFNPKDAVYSICGSASSRFEALSTSFVVLTVAS
jgi:hypothetical protein